jgi:hypothetical protein
MAVYINPCDDFIRLNNLIWCPTIIFIHYDFSYRVTL